MSPFPVRRPLAPTVLAAAVLVVALAGCAPAPTPPPAPAAPSCPAGGLPTLTAGTLTVGTDQPVYPPWYVDDDPTNGQGFESAVAYAVAENLGYAKDKVTWARVPFNAAIQPGAKTYDINLTEFSITEERKAAVDFSSPYYDVKQAVVTIGTSPAANAASLAELKNAKLGAQVGTTSYTAITDQIQPSQDPAVFDTNDQAVQALKNGQIDGIVVDLPTAYFMTAVQLDDGVIVGQLPLPDGEPEQFGAVLAKDSPLTDCVTSAVDTLREDGVLDQIGQEWLAQQGAPELS